MYPAGWFEREKRNAPHDKQRYAAENSEIHHVTSGFDRISARP
jgi:hypothetical protein